MINSKKDLAEARNVFEDNVCDNLVPWKSAFNSFHYYVDLLQKNHESISENIISLELARCAELLMVKKLHPQGISKSFILNKNEYGRSL